MSIPIVYVIPKTRQGIKITTGVLGVIWLVAAITTFFLWSADQKTLKETGQPDFNTLAQEELKDGFIVKGDIGFVFGDYAEVYETEFGVRKSDDSEMRYYIIPISDTNPDGTINLRYCVTYKAMPSDFDAMDRITQQSINGESDITPLTVENAKIEDLPDDIAQFLYYGEFYEGGSFIDLCAEYNFFGTADHREIASKLAPYMVCRTSTAGTSFLAVWVFLGMSAFCFAIMLLMIFFKAPIKGVIDLLPKDDFSKVRAMETLPDERENHEGYNG